MAGPEAARYVNLASWLSEFPLTRDAFATARLSAAHAAEICKALRWLPPQYRDAVEPQLVDYAFTARPEDIAGFVEALLDALGLDKTADVRRERRYAERGIDLGQTTHGQRSLIGTLTPEVGEKLAKALAVAGAKAGKDDDRTYRQRQHDALGDLADAYLAHHHTPSFDGAPPHRDHHHGPRDAGSPAAGRVAHPPVRRADQRRNRPPARLRRPTRARRPRPQRRNARHRPSRPRIHRLPTPRRLGPRPRPLRVPRLPQPTRPAPPHHLAQQPRPHQRRQRRLALPLPPPPHPRRRLDTPTNTRRPLPVDRTPRPTTHPNTPNRPTTPDGIAVQPRAT